MKHTLCFADLAVPQLFVSSGGCELTEMIHIDLYGTLASLKQCNQDKSLEWVFAYQCFCSLIQSLVDSLACSGFCQFSFIHLYMQLISINAH